MVFSFLEERGCYLLEKLGFEATWEVAIVFATSFIESGS